MLTLWVLGEAGKHSLTIGNSGGQNSRKRDPNGSRKSPASIRHFRWRLTCLTKRFRKLWRWSSTAWGDHSNVIHVLLHACTKWRLIFQWKFVLPQKKALFQSCHDFFRIFTLELWVFFTQIPRKSAEISWKLIKRFSPQIISHLGGWILTTAAAPSSQILETPLVFSWKNMKWTRILPRKITPKRKNLKKLAWSFMVKARIPHFSETPSSRGWSRPVAPKPRQ